MNKETVVVCLKKQINLRTGRKSELCIFVYTSVLSSAVTTGNFTLSSPCGRGRRSSDM